MTAFMLFGKYVDSDGNLSRSPTDDDDTSSMDETSRKRKLPTTSPNQLNGLSLELSLGESSRKKRKLTTTSPNYQEDYNYLLELPLESFAKIVERNLTRSPNQEDGLSLGRPFGDVDMGESSRKKRELTTTNPNQVNGLSLELSLGPIGHVDMGESSRKKRKLTTTSPNQEDYYYLLELPLESFAKIVERNLSTRSPPNQEDELCLELPTAPSTQEHQPDLQNPNQQDAYYQLLGFSLESFAKFVERNLTTRSPPNQEDGLSLGSSTQEDQPAMQNPNQEDGLSLGLPLSSSTQEDQNPNQEDEEKDEGVEEQEQEQEEEEEEEEVEEQEQQQEEEEEEEVVEEEQQQEEAPAPAPIPIFMFEKTLTSSDVERNHNRLLISGRANYLMASLTEEESGRVESNGRRDFLRVVTMTANNYGVEYILHLKRWSGSGALVLKHEWGKLVRANGLQIGDSVVARGYRVDGEFRLLLSIIRNHQVH